ncbi:MAG: (2Fe-2S) ferredoxin domain-containing protein [Bacteroidota bacterium]|nr:(2Fe-2S) ferredoxin domain-containing protein [Bacteroidota bacterium]
MKTKIRLTICLGSSCHSRGNDETLEVIKNYLEDKGLKGDVDFRGELCSGNCKEGPIFKIDDKIFQNVKATTVTRILDSCFDKK